VEALGRSHIIIHAGDIGNPEVLDELRSLAPVHAVRGNVDRGDWAAALPHSTVVDASGKLFYVTHNLADLDVDPAAAGFSAVVTGHSHQPRIEERNGVLFINPGSAGPRRFHLPICIARVVLRNNTLRAEIVALDK
jgi:putative phosphoesterase